jgi:hypothetical protein
MKCRLSITTLLTLVFATSLVGCSRKEIVVKQGHIAAFKSPIDLDLTHRQWEAIKSGDQTSMAEYNETVGNVISQISFRMTKKAAAPITLRTLDGDYPLIIDTAGIDNPVSVDRLIPVDSIKVKKGLRSEVKVDGIGSPLVVRQHWTPRDPMIATTGLWYPVTAILDLDDPMQPIMRFMDPTQLENTWVAVGKSDLPLQADYTASIARDLFDRQSQFVNLSGLIKYEKFSKHMGLFRISSFDPGKIPVVFVHGLNSTPNTWNNTINEMMADPVVRDKYEFWNFGYPTGAPVPFLSAKLRTEIERMTAYRRGRGSASNRVAIVAHSMGGLISKPLTQSSGSGLWDQVFTVPPEQLNVSEADRELLKNMFIFDPLPYIDRVVFLAVPHQGSPLADYKVGAVADLIIQAPSHLVTLGKNLLSASINQLTPLGKEVVGRVPTSVQQLNEDSAAIKLFSPLPLNPTVKYHSIMGNEKGSDRVANFQSTDGVVEYKSSHISGVESEKVFDGKHGIHLYPEAIKEIIRILNENAGYPNKPVMAEAKPVS